MYLWCHSCLIVNVLFVIFRSEGEASCIMLRWAKRFWTYVIKCLSFTSRLIYVCGFCVCVRDHMASLPQMTPLTWGVRAEFKPWQMGSGPEQQTFHNMFLFSNSSSPSSPYPFLHFSPETSISSKVVRMHLSIKHKPVVCIGRGCGNLPEHELPRKASLYSAIWMQCSTKLWRICRWIKGKEKWTPWMLVS